MNNKKHEICNKINKHNSSKYNIINENESKNRKLPNKDNNSEYIIIYDETNNKCKKSGKKLLKLYKLDIIQRRTSKSLLRVKYRNDKIQLIFFLIGILGLPIIPWILGWIIGKIILKPKSHKGKKLRQLNGTLTILCIIITSLFSIVYKQSLVSSEYSASTLFIDEANIEENKLKESINENKQQSKQILSCSSDIDIELIYLKQKAGIEKGLVLFIGKLLIDTWYNSKVLESAYENEFTIAAINPPEYGKSSKIIGSNNVTNSSYLYWLISSCLKSDTKKTVIVTHSNSITQKYVIPLIMNYKVSGIVFFNTNMGIKWFNAKNPLINDHYYYQPINMNNTIIRYIGDKKPVLYDFTKSSEINNSNISKNIKNNNFNTKKKINQQIITTTTKTTTKTTTITTTLEQISNTLENSEENLSNYETKEIMEYEEISNNDDVITDESQVNDQLHSGSGDLLNELSNSLISNIVNNNNQDTGEGSKNENTEITNNNNNNLSNKQTSINTSTVNSADLNNNESELYTSITTNNTVVTNKVTNTTKKTSVTTNTTKNTGVTTKATNTTNKTSVTTNTTKNTGVTTKATNTTNKASAKTNTTTKATNTTNKASAKTNTTTKVTNTTNKASPKTNTTTKVTNTTNKASAKTNTTTKVTNTTNKASAKTNTTTKVTNTTNKASAKTNTTTKVTNTTNKASPKTNTTTKVTNTTNKASAKTNTTTKVTNTTNKASPKTNTTTKVTNTTNKASAKTNTTTKVTNTTNKASPKTNTTTKVTNTTNKASAKTNTTTKVTNTTNKASPKTNTTTKVTNTTNKASAKTNTTTKVTNTTNKASPKTNTTTKKTTATKTTKSATVKKNQYKQQYLHAQKISKRRFLASKGTRSDNLKGIKDISKVISSCIASNTTYKYDTRWYLTEQNKMGPFGWFDGKYTIPGWKTMEMSYESFDFDFFDAEKLSNGTYILTFEYFNLLIETLNNILPVIAQRIAFMDMNNNINIHDKNSSVEIKQIDNESIINIDEAPTTFNDNRQNAYLKYRTNYELVPAQEIYCT